MNSKWKDVPNLFANGKFDIQLKGMIDKRKDWTVNNKLKIMWWCYACGSQGEWIIEDLNKCTLIARPISDLDKYELKHLDWDRSLRLHYENFTCDIYVNPFLFLLSRGVYPFPQSHFENDDLEARYESN